MAHKFYDDSDTCYIRLGPSKRIYTTRQLEFTYVCVIMCRRNESQVVDTRFVAHLVSFVYTDSDVVCNRGITGSGK